MKTVAKYSLLLTAVASAGALIVSDGWAALAVVAGSALGLANIASLIFLVRRMVGGGARVVSFLVWAAKFSILMCILYLFIVSFKLSVLGLLLGLTLPATVLVADNLIHARRGNLRHA